MKKKHWRAVLTAFTLGPTGLHRHYLEEHGWGIAMGVVTLVSLPFALIYDGAGAGLAVLIPALMAAADGARLLNLSGDEFNRRYNTSTLVLTPHGERPAVPFHQTAVNVTVNAPPTADADVLSRLEKLQGLREKGVLTDEEFAAQKARLLADG